MNETPRPAFGPLGSENPGFVLRILHLALPFDSHLDPISFVVPWRWLPISFASR